MIVKTIPVSWIIADEHRLDCGPFVKGSIEAKMKIQALPCKKQPLEQLTKDGILGMYHVGQDKITWVDDPDYGIPFLRSSDILKADISDQVLISKRQVKNNPLFQCPEGTSLITRSGSIGNMAYMRKDMENTAISQDVLKIVPDKNKIFPGYLYSFLNSKYGIPIVTGGTFGSIIVHIEAENISKLPVPRLGAVEEQAHQLVQQAADLRVEANRLLKDVTKDLEFEIGGGPIEWKHSHVQSFAVETRTVTNMFSRLDAFHYVGYVGEAIEKAAVPLEEIKPYARALRPPIMKRIRVEESGYEFLGGSELVTMEQRSETKISDRTPSIERFIVHPGYVLFQCVGQRYGLFGRPVLASRAIIGKAVTEAVMRLIPYDPHDAGYISVYLATEFGQRLVMRHSAGTSIPVLQEDGAEKILIYWPDSNRRHAISEVAEKAWENRALATELEDQARALVERAIEEGGQ